MEGLRNSPWTDPRGFSDRAPNVVLPDLILPKFVDLTGLGEFSRTELSKLGGGAFAAEPVLRLRMLPGVLSDLAVLGRLRGVCDSSDVCRCWNVFVDARKSVAMSLSLLELDVGLALKDLKGGAMNESLELGLEEDCIGLSGLKNVESLLRTAGDAGMMFCSVSMVLSDSDRWSLGSTSLSSVV